MAELSAEEREAYEHEGARRYLKDEAVNPLTEPVPEAPEITEARQRGADREERLEKESEREEELQNLRDRHRRR